jgi:glycosyltransferase involved in cell wall biosynthesis
VPGVAEATQQRRVEDVVRIVHAPSDPVGKGSEEINQAIQNLIKQGHRIEYVAVVGRTNREVKEILAGCDFVVDQLYYDVSLSILGTEAAFLGKAVLFGSYARDEFKKVVPAAHLPPAVVCRPEEIEGAIKGLVVDQKLRARLGMNGREFAGRNYGPKRVAENLLRLIANDIPGDWWFDPNSLEYCHGYGYSETGVKSRIRELIEKEGAESLCLDDKPLLKERFIKFAFAP